MKLFPISISLVLATSLAVACLTGCDGDDNTLTVPPTDAGSSSDAAKDATSGHDGGDASTSDAAADGSADDATTDDGAADSTVPDDAAETGASEAGALDTGTPDTGVDAADAGDTDADAGT
jgi:hypothetical protein